MKRISTWYGAAALVIGSIGPVQADDRCGAALRPYAVAVVDRVVVGAEALAKRIEAGDLEGARRAWIDARSGWERGEPFLVPYFPEAIAAIDPWPDAGSGFHAIEPILFVDGNVAAASDLARKLVRDAVALQWQLGTTDLGAEGLIDGMVATAIDIGQAKASGGESPLAGTSLRDLQDRLQGLEVLYALSFAPLTRSRHRALHARIVGGMIALAAALRVPSIAEIEGAAVVLLSEKLRDDFQEIAVLVELEGTEHLE